MWKTKLWRHQGQWRRRKRCSRLESRISPANHELHVGTRCPSAAHEGTIQSRSPHAACWEAHSKTSLWLKLQLYRRVYGRARGLAGAAAHGGLEQNCTPCYGHMQEQFLKNCSLWKAHIGSFGKDCIWWEVHYAEKQKWEWRSKRDKVLWTNYSPILYCSALLGGEQKKVERWKVVLVCF